MCFYILRQGFEFYSCSWPQTWGFLAPVSRAQSFRDLQWALGWSGFSYRINPGAQQVSILSPPRTSYRSLFQYQVFLGQWSNQWQTGKVQASHVPSPVSQQASVWSIDEGLRGCGLGWQDDLPEGSLSGAQGFIWNAPLPFLTFLLAPALVLTCALARSIVSSDYLS
jgi:hypothetical protein